MNAQFKWVVILWLGLSLSTSFARARDDWGPLVSELRGLRQELTLIRQAIQSRAR